MSKIDAGRWLHVLAFSDDLIDLDETGLAGINPASSIIGKEFDQRIAAARKALRCERMAVPSVIISDNFCKEGGLVHPGGGRIAQFYDPAYQGRDQCTLSDIVRVGQSSHQAALATKISQ